MCGVQNEFKENIFIVKFIATCTEFICEILE